MQKIGFGCLVGFFAEQVLHVVAFGMLFFCNPWFVIDMLAVSLSIAIELKEETLNDVFELCILIRLWKVAVFAFDTVLLDHEGKEL